MKRIIDSDGNTVALVFDISCITRKNNTIFVPVPDGWGIHIGLAYKVKGYSVKPHYHMRSPLPTRVGTEVLLVFKGHIRIKLYSIRGKITAIKLSEGEGILMKCAHSVEFLEDSIVIEIKEGPYPGPENDKNMVN